MASDQKCVICGRLLGTVNISEHHLIPRTFDKKSPTILIHNICHNKLHASFSERELQHYYHTIERILEHEEIIKFIKWVSKKPTDFYSKNDETNIRYNKRRK